MAPRYTPLLLCVAFLFCFAPVRVHCKKHHKKDYAEADYALSRLELEHICTEYANSENTNFHIAAEKTVTQFASTKKQKKTKSPPPSGGQSPPSGGSGGSITVGSGGNFNSIQAAVNAAKAGDTITINGGDYFEKVIVPSKLSNLMIIGQNNPRIYYNKNAGQAGTLAKSASFSVFADGVYCTGVTFENTSPLPHGQDGGQAVALAVNADGVVIDSCTIKSTQDTLYAMAGSQTYKNCVIIGSVDYICGDARAVFQSCTMKTIGGSYTAVAAQLNSCGKNTGFAFIGGSVQGNGNTWLGRTWGKCATIIYSGTSISGANSKGWITMGSSSFSKTARFGGVNIGNTGGWVSWALSASEASSVLSTIS